MVLEAHYDVVPDGAEPVLTLLHLGDDTGVDVRVEVPALDIAHVATLDWHGEADGDREPCTIVGRISESFLGVHGREHTITMDYIEVELGAIERLCRLSISGERLLDLLCLAKVEQTDATAFLTWFR